MTSHFVFQLKGFCQNVTKTGGMMKKVELLIIIILTINVSAQNYDSFISHSKHPVVLGIYPTVLNYGASNHFHQILAFEFGFTEQDKIIFKGGLFTEARFQINWFRKIYMKPFILSFSPGLGAFWGTFIDLDAGITIPFSNGVFLTNQMQINLYLDTDRSKPTQSDSPIWYVINLQAPLGRTSQLIAEFGLPMNEHNFTYFGVGFKFYF